MTFTAKQYEIAATVLDHHFSNTAKGWIEYLENQAKIRRNKPTYTFVRRCVPGPGLMLPEDEGKDCYYFETTPNSAGQWSAHIIPVEKFWGAVA